MLVLAGLQMGYIPKRPTMVQKVPVGVAVEAGAIAGSRALRVVDTLRHPCLKAAVRKQVEKLRVEGPAT